jgi:hypothetical protein
MLGKFVLQMDPECELQEAISECVNACNQLQKMAKHSPYEHIFGRSSNETEDLVPSGQQLAERRLLARKCFLDAEYEDKARRAEAMRARVWKTWRAGEMVYFWRKGKGREQRPGKKGGWYGPALVLHQEQKLREGQLRHSNCVWVTHGDQLIRCAVEQLRPASEAEKMMFELRDRAIPWIQSSR